MNLDSENCHALYTNGLRMNSEFILVMSTSELVYKEYDSVVTGLSAQFQNIEPFLLLKSAMLRRKYPSEQKHHFWLELSYKHGVNTDEKSARIFREVGRFPSYHGHYRFLLDLEAELSKLLLIAADKDLERIGGEVFPLSA